VEKFFLEPIASRSTLGKGPFRKRTPTEGLGFEEQKTVVESVKKELKKEMGWKQWHGN